MFTWVTARYLQREKCQCKFEKGRNNVIQKVKTLQFFSFASNTCFKLENVTSVPQILQKF